MASLTDLAVRIAQDIKAVPKGDKGDKGDQGDAGPAGGSDAATAEWISTGPLTREATDATVATMVAAPDALVSSAVREQIAVHAQAKNPAVRFDEFPLALTNTTTINSSPVHGASVVESGGWVYAVYFAADMNPHVARRRVAETAWEVFDLSNLPGNPMFAPAPVDGHNTIAIGVDSAGYIHVSGNHHAVPLNYIRSVVPREITQWESPGMVGADEAAVTYPVFEIAHTGELMFFYRSGYSSDGDLILNHYSTTTRTWARVGTVIKGRGWVSTPEHPYTNMSAYPSRVAVDRATGRIHLWWVWRGTTDVASNHDLHYMYSTDQGLTWRDASGMTLSAPVTGATASTLVFSGGSGHVAFGATVDSSGVPHAIVRFRGEIDETRHYWRDGAAFDYEVIGTGSMGPASLFATTTGKIYAVYNMARRAVVQEISPGIGEPIQIAPWDMGSWSPNFDQFGQQEDVLRVLLAPTTENPGGNFGGVLTLPISDAVLSDVAADILSPSRSVTSPMPLAPDSRSGLPSYALQQGFYYGPGSQRGNSPALPNGTFRGHPITAGNAGTVIEAACNVVTAGAAGAKARFVVFELNGKVRTQSADFDVTATGTRSASLAFRLSKGETVLIGVLAHSSSGAGAVFTALQSIHDARIPLTSPTSYFNGARAGFALTGLVTPVGDQSPFVENAGVTDSVPIVVVKAGAVAQDWA